MTAPRQVLRGTTYLVTRRVSQRQYLLKPSPTVDAVFAYVLALAARKFGVLIHAYCVMSDHYHLVLTDPEARLPAFGQYLGAFVARALNGFYGRREAFWAPSSYSAVTLVASEDILEKAAYTLANPVAAGLVRRGRDWPGLWSAPELVGGAPLQFARPDVFFRSRGSMPDHAALALQAPPGFESAEQFRRALIERVSALEQEAARELEAQGRSFVGRERVDRQEHTGRATSPEPRGELNPRVAARDPSKLREALEQLAAFLAHYRDAWKRFRGGLRDAAFPPGTYRMRVVFGMGCAEGT